MLELYDEVDVEEKELEELETMFATLLMVLLMVSEMELLLLLFDILYVTFAIDC